MIRHKKFPKSLLENEQKLMIINYEERKVLVGIDRKFLKRFIIMERQTNGRKCMATYKTAAYNTKFNICSLYLLSILLVTRLPGSYIL